MQNMENAEPFYYVTKRYNEYKGDQSYGTLACTRQAGNTLRNAQGMVAQSETTLSPKCCCCCYYWNAVTLSKSGLKPPLLVLIHPSPVSDVWFSCWCHTQSAP